MSDTAPLEERTSRAPRKRATRQRETTPKRVVAAAPVKAPAQPKVEPVQPAAAPRKAPTAIAAEKFSVLAKRKRLFITVLILAIGIGSSAAIGYSDKGTIDVAEVIAERNQRAKESGDTTMVNVPVQNRNNVPDGGLIGLGDIEEAKPEATSSSATTTESMATTSEQKTEAVSE